MMDARASALKSLGRNVTTFNQRRSVNIRTGRVSKRSLRCRPIYAASDVSKEIAEEEDFTEPEECIPFFDRDGEVMEVLCCDYGFRSGAGRMYQDKYGEIPGNVWQLGVENFRQEYKSLRRSLRYDEFQKISEQNPPVGPLGQVGYFLGSLVVRAFAGIDGLLEKGGLLSTIKPKNPPKEVSDSDGEFNSDCSAVRTKLSKLVLSNDAIWDRERRREAGGGKVDTPFYIRAAYLALCVMLDVLYNNRPLQRFWFLEVVARMPYFSYISMLHLYESFGWWRAGAELRRVHFAEEWNELHHLQIMESLGGDQYWVDRFMAQHAAIVYYWMLIVFFLVSPSLAYNFSELVEAHAVDTYEEFVESNEELLKSMPPPIAALQYYRSEDLYMFDLFQTSKENLEPRRPPCSNLFDVFRNIADDEGEHVKTMRACQDCSIMEELQNNVGGNSNQNSK